jgi:heme-degrading monooxygenase HmoA
MSYKIIIAMIVFFGFMSCRQEEPAAGTVEYAPFELADHADEAALLAESEVLQRDFLIRQQGFIRRELLKIKDRQYADLVYWRSKEDAMNAMAQAEQSEVCRRYFGLMKMTSNDPAEGVVHLDHLRTYK